VIHEVDSALRTLIEREATGTRDVEVVFDAPTREWAGRRNSPTIDVYLYDIREDMRRRERGMHNVYDERKIIVSRHLPPRHFKLSYLVTAWTQRPEDEHRLLSSLLGCFLRYDALPANVLTGPLTELGLPVPITIALPPPEDRAFADVWSALGGELKPSIDLVVIVPMDTGQQFHTGPPVAIPPTIDLGGSGGWPAREARSGLNGYQTAASWQAGHGGLVLAEASARDADDVTGAGETADSDSGTGRRRRRKAGSETVSESGSAGAAAESARGSEQPGTAGTSAAGSWQVATGWADAMAPLGPASSAGDVPPPATGGGTESSKTGGTGSSTASGAGGSRSSGSGGRPGPRVAMTRVRQTKKKP
jgi:hypothetical protein